MKDFDEILPMRMFAVKIPVYMLIAATNLVLIVAADIRIVNYYLKEKGKTIHDDCKKKIDTAHNPGILKLRERMKKVCFVTVLVFSVFVICSTWIKIFYFIDFGLIIVFSYAVPISSFYRVFWRNVLVHVLLC